MNDYDEKGRRVLVVYVFIFLLMVLILAIGGYLSYSNFEREIRHQAENQLSAIAELKVNELQNWRRERLGDARAFYNNQVFSEVVERYFKSPTDTEARRQIVSSLEYYQSYAQYYRISLMDITGTNRVVIPDNSEEGRQADEQLKVDAASSLQLGEVAFLDFQREDNGRIYLSILVPIFADQTVARPLGVLVLRIDPATYLYPYINQWPVPSNTSETLLVRRDGEDVLFLNKLRFAPDAALNLRLPLTSTALPSAQAVLGRSGVMEGVDYRGEVVLADIRPVPNSPWYLVSKMDAAEVYAPLRARLWQILLIIGMAILVSGLVVTLVWRQQRILFYRTKIASADKLRESEEKFRKAFVLSPDAININRLHDSMYVSINNSFTKITGYTPDDLIGKTSLDLNIWADAQDRQRLVDGLLQNGQVENFEACFRMKNGEIKRGLMSASFLELDGIPHIISITRDITNIRLVDQKMREAQLVLESSPVVLFRWKAAEGWPVELVSENIAQFGYSPEEFISGAVSYASIVHPDDLERVGREVREYSASGVDHFQQEYRIVTKDGRIRWTDDRTMIDRDAQGNIIRYQGTIMDVTERRQAEESLRQSEEFRNRVFESSYIPIVVMEADTQKFIDCNQSAVKIYGFASKDATLGKTPLDVSAPVQYHGTASDEMVTHYVNHALANGSVVFEWRHQRQNGEIWDAEVHLMSFVLGDKQLLQFSLIDITERKRAEVELDRQTTLFRKLFEGSPQAIAVVDQEDRILNVNRSFENLFGYFESEAQGHYVNDLLVSKPYLKEAQEINQISLGSGQVVQRETVRHTKDGRPVNVSLIGYPVALKQRPIGGFAIYQDITARKQAEESLRQSEERFHTLYDNATIGLYRTTPDGQVLMLNPAGLRMLGFDSFDEVAELNLERERYNLDYSRREFREKLESQGVVVGWENGWIRKDGSSIFVRESAKVVRDETGRVLYYDGSFEDITERRRAEDALRASEENLSITLHSIGDGVISTDKAGLVVNMNPMAEKYCGWTLGEAKGRPLVEIFHIINAETRTEAENPVKEVMENGRIVGLANHTVLISRSGDEYQIADSAAPITDRTGNVVGVVLVFSDVTEKYRAAEKLRESETNFADIFQTVPDGIAYTTLAGQVLSVNNSLEKLLGIPSSQIVGRSIFNLAKDLLSVNNAMTALPVLAKLVQGEVVEPFEVEYRDKTLEITAIINRSSGRLTGVVRDITERKQAKHALEESEQKFKQLFAVSPDALIFADTSTMEILEANDAALKLYGYSREELLKLRPIDLSAQPDATAQALRNGEDLIPLRYHRRKDGTVFPVEMTTNTFEWKGRRVQFGAIRDITARKRAEDALCQSESQLSVIFNNNHDMQLLVAVESDGNLRIAAVNQHYIDVARAFRYDFSAQSLVGQTIEHMLRDVLGIKDELLDLTLRRYRQPVTTGLPIHYEEDLETPGGHYFAEVTIVPVFDGNGACNHLLWTSHDITERKKVEQALRKSEEKLGSIFRVAPTGIGVVSNRVLVEVNPRICEMTGYTKEELLGQSARILYPTQEEFEWVGKEKYKQIAEKGTGVVETRWQMQDGSIIDVLLASTPIDPADISKGVTFTALDITERRRAEEEVRRQSAMFRNLFESSPEAIAVLDQEDRVLEVNHSFEALFGYSKPEAQGRNINELLAPEPYFEDARNVSQTVLGECRIVEKETIRCTKDKHPVDVSIIGYPIVAGQRMIGAYGIYRDITERKKVERSLYERERQYRTLVEQIPAIVYVDDVRGGIQTMYIGPQIEQILGYTPQEWLEKSPSIWDTCVHPDDRQPINAKFLRCATEGEPFEAEYRMQTADGRLVWVHDQAVLLRDEDGTPQLIHGVMQDITESKQVEEALRAAEEKYRNIFENVMEAITQTTPEGKYITVNPAAARIMGYDSPEEMIADPRSLDRQFYVEPGRREEFKRLMEEHDTISGFESEAYRKDGSRIWVVENSRAIRDKHGKTLYYEGTAQEITERKRAERVLRESEEKYRSVVEKSHDGILLLDEQGIIIEWNQAMELLTGLPRNEVIGRFSWDVLYQFSTSELKTSERLQLLKESIQEFLKTGQAPWLGKTLEVAICRPDGTVRTALESNFPIETARGFMRGSVFLDITERKQSEVALRTSESNLTAALKVAQMGNWEFDVATGEFIFNDQYYILHGMTAEDAGGYRMSAEKFAANLVHPEDAYAVSGSIQKALESTDPNFQYQIEGRILRANGEARWVTVWFMAEKDSQGRTVRLRGVNQDITERVKTLESLRESEAIFSSFLEHSPVYVFFKDRDIRSLMLSRNYEQMLGMPIRDLLGKTMDDLFPSDLAKSMVADDMRILKEGKRITVEEQFNGRIYETTKFPVFKDGMPYLLAGFTLDITERKRAEEELGRQTALFRSLFERSPEAITIVDKEDRIVNVNRSFEALFGYSEAEIQGRYVNDLIVSEQYKDEAEGITQTSLEEGRIVEKETVRCTKDGRPVDVFMVGYPIVVEGQIIGGSGIYRDITERKRAEETLKGQNKYLFALQETALELVSQLDLNVLLENIVKRAGQIIGTTSGFLDLVDVKTDQLVPHIGLGVLVESLKHPAQPGEGVAGTVWQTGQTLVINNYDDWAGRISGYTHHILSSVVGVPLVSGGKVLGVLGVGHEYSTQRTIGPESVEILIQFSRLATIAIENARLFATAQQEIKDRKQAEEALRASEIMFRVAFDNAPTGMSLIGPDGFTYLAVNPLLCDMFGYTKEEFLGNSINLVTHPDDEDRSNEWIRKKYNDEPCEPEIEKRYIHKDGHIVWGLVRAQWIKNEDGSHRMAVAHILDITTRKLVENALRESEQRYKLVSELTSDYIYMVTIAADGKTSLDFVTESYYGITERSMEEARTVREWNKIIHPDDFDRFMEFLQNMLVTRQAGQLECRSYVGSGRMRWIEVFARPEWDEQEGRITTIVGAVKDITARKQAEEEIRKLNTELEQRVQERTVQLENTNKELEAFSYSVSHDLRAPLRGIDGWSQALLEDYQDKLDDQGRQYIERVRSETQRMGHLIDDMLKLSRLTRAEMNREQVDLSALAEAIAGRLRQEEPRRGVRFDIQPGVTAEGDANLLEAALLNLLGNAFKFTGRRADALIEFGQMESENQRIFFVRDNGAGFDMAYAQKLFGAFQRMHKSSEFPGTGVGLAIVQRIIHRHGGRVWAEAEPGRGAVFYFTLG